MDDSWNGASIMETVDDDEEEKVEEKPQNRDIREEARKQISKYIARTGESEKKLRSDAEKLAKDVISARCDDLLYLDGYNDSDCILKRFDGEMAANKQLFAGGEEKNYFSSIIYDPFKGDKLVGVATDTSLSRKNKTFSCITPDYAVYLQEEVQEGSETDAIAAEASEVKENAQAFLFEALCQTAILVKLGRRDPKETKKLTIASLSELSADGKQLYQSFLKKLETAYKSIQTLPISQDVHGVRILCKSLEKKLCDCLSHLNGISKENDEANFDVAFSTLLSLDMLLFNFKKSGLRTGLGDTGAIDLELKEEKANAEREIGNRLSDFSYSVRRGEFNAEELKTLVEDCTHFKPLNQRNTLERKNKLSVISNLHEHPEYDEEVGNEVDLNSTGLFFKNWGDPECRTTLIVHKASAYLLDVSKELKVLLKYCIGRLPELSYRSYAEIQRDHHCVGFGVPRIVPLYGCDSPHFRGKLRANPLRRNYTRENSSTPHLVSGMPTSVYKKRIAFVSLETARSGEKRGDLCISQLPQMKEKTVVLKAVWKNKESSSFGELVDTIPGIVLSERFLIWISRNKEGDRLCWVNLHKNLFGMCKMNKIISVGFSVDYNRVWVGMSDGVCHILDCEQETLIFKGSIHIKTPLPICRMEMTGKRVFVMAEGCMHLFDSREKDAKHSMYNFGEIADFSVRNYRLIVQRSDNLMMYLPTNDCSNVCKVDKTMMDFSSKYFQPSVSCTKRNMVSMKRGVVSVVGKHLLFMRLFDAVPIQNKS
jgi:hypothetical protein